MDVLEYKLEEWLSDAEKIEYSDYWNDESLEMSKEWWILDGNFSKMEVYLEKINAVAQMTACIQVAQKCFKQTLSGIGVDLAAGALWATPHLLRLGAQKIYSVEYSRHRLLKIGPAVLRHYQVETAQVMLALGDFHRLNIPDSALDFVFMSQAFHHSETPRKLLAEVRRVLKPQGIVIITGEHITRPSFFAYIRQPLRFIAAKILSSALQKKIFGKELLQYELWLGQGDFFAKDKTLGDHYFTAAQYRRLFTQHGFEHINLQQADWDSQAFVLTPKEKK